MANPASDDRLFALGDDIASLILFRLPVDDLCQFLCVSKRWYSTITFPSFDISHHRDHHSCISCGFLYHLVDPALSSTRTLDISQVEAIPCRRHKYEHSLPSLLLDYLRSMTLDAVSSSSSLPIPTSASSSFSTRTSSRSTFFFIKSIKRKF